VCVSRVFRISVFVLLVLPICVGPARAEVPAEVESLDWCPSSRNCLIWSAAAGATAYEVYRGSGSDLADLLDATIDSCTVDEYSTPSTGDALVESPPPGTLHWYLVRARNGQDFGDAGSATASPRIVDSSGICAMSGGLVINELDYDQPGIDSGEFVEIYNPGPSARPLTGLVLIFVNGTSGAEYGRVDLSQAGESLAAGAYLVAGTTAVVSAVPPGTRERRSSSCRVRATTSRTALRMELPCSIPVREFSSTRCRTRGRFPPRSSTACPGRSIWSREPLPQPSIRARRSGLLSVCRTAVTPVTRSWTGASPACRRPGCQICRDADGLPSTARPLSESLRPRLVVEQPSCCRRSIDTARSPASSSARRACVTRVERDCARCSS